MSSETDLDTDILTKLHGFTEMTGQNSTITSNNQVNTKQQNVL